MIDFIQKNIHLLTLDHLKMYADKKNISYTEKELQIIYQFLQDNYQELLKGSITCIEKIQSKINPTLLNQLITLYQEYKNKYL